MIPDTRKPVHRAHVSGGVGAPRRRARRALSSVVLAAGLATGAMGLAACGDDDEDLDDIDVDVTTETDMTGVGATVEPGGMGGTNTTPSSGSTDLTTGGTATGGSATTPTPVSGSVSNDDGGGG